MEALNYKDISLNILQLLRDGTTYKAATRVCRLWHTICREDLRWMIAKYSNHLWTLINKYPDEKWNWYWISTNPNITWEIISGNPDNPWNWNGISQNPNIPWELINSHLRENPSNKEWDWDWDWISKSPN